MTSFPTRIATLAPLAAIACFASQPAAAQVATPAFGANCSSSQTGIPVSNSAGVAASMGSASSAIAAAIGAVDTAFLGQQGSAFVSAPANPAPDQPGGGIWIRGVGGQNDVRTSSSTTLTSTNSTNGQPANVTNVNCANAQHLTFSGVQAGADIARLNVNDWNIHIGSTVGYMAAKSDDTNQLYPFENSFQVPFLGAYLVATKGRFFADVAVRQNFMNINLFNPSYGFMNQPISAHGWTASASAGYNFDAGNGWFIEPSAGFSYSRTSVDSFTAPGNQFSGGITSTVAISDIESQLGRLSLRAGKTIVTQNVIWQPFATASVFHEFAGNINATATGPGFIVGTSTFPIDLIARNSTSRVGTYGQYSAGIAAQSVETGLLSYARFDYKDGPNIDGWGFSAGLRYQFRPDVVAAPMYTKAVKAPVAVIGATDWTGFYVGAVMGANYGRTDLTMSSTPLEYARPWVAGALGGVEAGYNRQLSNRWVVGIEGDIAATNNKGSRTLSPAVVSIQQNVPTPNALVGSDKSSWLATVTGRLGYAAQRTLYYVKAGVAVEDGTVSVTCFDPQFAGICRHPAEGTLAFAPGGSISKSYTRVGWTAGFGTEFDFGKGWSAKSEVNYISFSDDTALSSNRVTSLSDSSYLWQGKIGLNYRFGSPVVAKY